MLKHILRESRAKALIFDMDGTLVDNMDFHFKTWIDWAKMEGLTMSEEELLSKTHGTIGEIVRRLFPDVTSEDELYELGERKEAYYREVYKPHLKLIPGLAEFLEEAKSAGIPMAVATAGNWANVKFTLEGTGTRDYFPVIIAGEDVQHGKPHPEVFLKAAAKLEIEPEGCLVFEDSPAGTEAGRRAGMKVIVVNQMNERKDFGPHQHVLHWAKDYFDLRFSIDD